MDQRTTYLLQVFEKIGSPLVAAAGEVALRRAMGDPSLAQEGPEGDPVAEAKRVAELLSRSTQAGLQMARFFDIRDESSGDAVRLALAALAGPLLANHYRMSGRVPSDREIDKIATALEAVMAFSDNFSAAATESAARLSSIESDFAPADETQIQIRFIQALAPAVNAIAAFSFGQQEKKLLQDVTERLTADARRVRSSLLPGVKPADASMVDLALLRTAVLLYSQCHFAEMARMMTLDEATRQRLNPSEGLGTVWKAYSLRLDMLETLSHFLVPGAESASSSGSVAPAPVAQQAAAPVAPPPPPPAAAPEVPAQAPAATGAPANPMAFFRKKPDQSSNEGGQST